MYYVYVLKGYKYYVGSTNNIERRIKEHRLGKTYTTKNIGNFSLIGYFQFENEKDAREYEKKIKANGHYERLEHRINFIKMDGA